MTEEIATTIDPGHSIVPVLEFGPNGEILSVLGTGFIIGEQPFVVTAKHVLEGHLDAVSSTVGTLADPPTPGRPSVLVEHPLTVYPFEDDIKLSSDHDIAAVPVPDLPWIQPLSVSNEPVPNNLNVLAYEFSSTRIEPLPSGRRHVELTPFTHKGNVLRHYMSEYPERRPTPSFDTSFPALQGASGAPVVREHDFAVVGMLVANLERHLLPAQVVRLETDDRTVEEISYFLPVGKGIEAHFVLEVLDEMGIPVTPIG